MYGAATAFLQLRPQHGGVSQRQIAGQSKPLCGQRAANPAEVPVRVAQGSIGFTESGAQYDLFQGPIMPPVQQGSDAIDQDRLFALCQIGKQTVPDHGVERVTKVSPLNRTIFYFHGGSIKGCRGGTVAGS